MPEFFPDPRSSTNVEGFTVVVEMVMAEVTPGLRCNDCMLPSAATLHLELRVVPSGRRIHTVYHSHCLDCGGHNVESP